MNVGGMFVALLGQDCQWLLNGFDILFFMVFVLVNTIFFRVKLRSLHMRNFYTGCRVNDFILPE